MSTKHIRGRFLFKEVNERGHDLPLGSVTKDGGVEYRSDLDISVWNPGDDVSGYKRVRPDDFVIGLRSFQSGIGHSSIEALVSPAYTVLRSVSPLVHPPFFRHLFKSSWYVSHLENVAQGIRQGRTIAVEDFYNIECPIPPLQKQWAIADYLDTETARIDALIEKKRQLIELLDERRSAFIGRAVTVGLDDARTTSTGNEFAPIVREGWTLNRLRHVVEQIVDTAHKTAPVVDDGEYLVVRTANVKSGTLVLDGARYTDKAAWTEWTARGVPAAGDVIFTREAPAGEACLVPEGTTLCIGQRTVLLRPNKSMIDGEWIVHSIYSGAAQRFIELLSKSTTVPHINISDIPDMPVVLPPLEEQKSVLSAVRREVSRLVGLKEKLRDQIDLLHERRQALITAAVTGGLEVPGVAA